MKHALWHQKPRRLRDDVDRVADHLADMGIQQLRVEINSASDWDFDADITAGEFASVAAALAKRDIETVPMVWAIPRPHYIQSLLAWCADAIDAAASTALASAGRAVPAVEYDLEGRWKDWAVRAYGSLYEAGCELTEGVHDIDPQLGQWATTYLEHGEIKQEIDWPSHAADPSDLLEREDDLTLCEHITAITPQAYSRCKTKDGQRLEAYKPGARYGPVRLQAMAAERVRIVNQMRRALRHPSLDLHVGLAAYSQTGYEDLGWPAERMMSAAYLEAASHDPEVISWWDYVNLVSHDYAEQGVRSAIAKMCLPPP